VQLYFFDLHWGDERFLDEEGIAHFDEGSALYYARRVADKIGRDADHGSLRVEVRTSEGTLLASIAPSEGRGSEQLALVGRLYPGLLRGAASASCAALEAASSRS
jgi:hypothetical protein